MGQFLCLCLVSDLKMAQFITTHINNILILNQVLNPELIHKEKCYKIHTKLNVA